MGAAEFGVTNTSTNTINEFLITPWKGAITSLRSCNVRTSSALAIDTRRQAFARAVIRLNRPAEGPAGILESRIRLTKN